MYSSSFSYNTVCLHPLVVLMPFPFDFSPIFLFSFSFSFLFLFCVLKVYLSSYLSLFSFTLSKKITSSNKETISSLQILGFINSSKDLSSTFLSSLLTQSNIGFPSLFKLYFPQFLRHISRVSLLYLISP